MDWSDLRMFWAVAESGSFAAAARALGVQVSTVARRIDDLEERLAVRLLERSPQGVALTEAGEEAFELARTMERSATAFERLSRDRDRRPEGRVRVMTPDGVGAYILAPAYADFVRENPKITLELECGFWPADPLSERPEIAIQYDEPKDPDAIATPLAHIHYCLFAARSYVDLYGLPDTLQVAAGHRYIHHIAQTRQKEGWRGRFEAFQELANVSMLTNSSSVVLGATREGAGISALPSGVVRIAPELVMVGGGPVASVRLWMLHHRDLRRTARIRLVTDWIKTLFDTRTHAWFRPEFEHPDSFRHAPAAAPEVAA
jgi:DNA-binding transcriptional LysR family regulator